MIQSESIYDGGPAFPNVPPDPSARTWHHGMMLRDYFAIHETLSDYDNCQISKKWMEEVVGRPMPDASDAMQSVLFDCEFRARFKYLRADAMIQARSGHGRPSGEA